MRGRTPEWLWWAGSSAVGLGLLLAGCDSPAALPWPSEEPAREVPGWQRGPDLPRAVGYAGAAVHRDRIWVAGGRTGIGPPVPWVFHTVGDGQAWTEGPPLPEPLSDVRLLVLRDTLFALGNPLAFGPESALLLALDEAESRWVPRSSHGDFRKDHDAVVVGDEVWMVGGEIIVDNLHWPDVHGEWIQVLGLDGRWRYRGHVPRERRRHRAVVAGDVLHLLGGVSDASGELPVRVVDRLDLSTDEWLEPLEDADAYERSAVVVMDGRIHVLGGLSGQLPVDAHRVLDPATGGWKALPDPPRGFGAAAAVVHRGELWVLGGRRDHRESGWERVDVYRPPDADP